MNCLTPFYVRDLSIVDLGICRGSQNQSPVDTEGQLQFLGIFYSMGVGAPNVSLVQGSTVHVY